MKIIGCIFSILCVFSLVSTAVAQKTRKLVENLDIQGNRRLRDDDLLKLIKTRPGNWFNEKQVQKDLQSLLKTGLFHPINTRVFTEEAARGGVSVIFEVRELPLITELKFDGLRHFSQEEIVAELRKKNLAIEAGKPYDVVKMRKASQAVREFLAKRGFPNANVKFTQEEVSATTVKLTFVIAESPN